MRKDALLEQATMMDTRAPVIPDLISQPAGNGRLIVNEADINAWTERLKRTYTGEVQRIATKLKEEEIASLSRHFTEEKKYQKLKHDNDNYQLHISRVEASNRIMQSQHARLEGGLTELQGQLQAESISHGHTKQRLEKARTEHDEAIKSYEVKHLDLKKQLEDQNRELEEMKTQLREEESKCNHVRTQYEHSQQRVEMLIAQCHSVTSQYEQTKASLEDRITTMTTKYKTEITSHAQTKEREVQTMQKEYEEKLKAKEHEIQQLMGVHERGVRELTDADLRQELEEEITKRLQMRVRVVATLKNDFAIIQNIFHELSEARRSFCHGAMTQGAVFELLDELGMQLMILRDRKQADIAVMSTKRKQESELDKRTVKRQRM
ncbi:hypothetical protein VNI00_015935 [Paramarasmius palmivorus]|uniref:Uncharacterized protein n=1 Tax=Paramarasmius palmivorus TaxID=297713 RepID=A0AAW0BGW8_9AGAR